METAALTMERSEARELYEKYQAHLHFGEAIDREVSRAYRLLAQGKLIIKAVESVKVAGFGEDNRPKLALIRADARECYWQSRMDGSGRFSAQNRWRTFASDISLPADTFKRGNFPNGRAIVPIIPAHLRPKHSLINYHILWEADWRAVPRDPYLLRRLGKGDLWLVTAMWDLTEVERIALQARV